MNIYTGILSLVFILAVMATILYKFYGKRKIEISVFIFYVIILYGIMSFVKMILGEPDLGLFESFYDIETVTYFHYGIPLLVLVVVMSFFHGRIVKEEFGSRFVMLFNSLFSFSTMLEFLICGAINNRFYVVTAVVSAAVTLLASILYKGNIDYCRKDGINKRFFFIQPIILFWAVTVIVFEPNQLILNNLEEFQIPYFHFLAITSSATFVITLIYTLISTFILSDKQLKLFGALLFGISFAGYIQGNFMNGEMDVMDGTIQLWSMQTKLTNGAVWLIIILISVLINVYFSNKKIRKICQLICIYLCLTQVVSLVYMIVSTNLSSKEKEYLLTTNHALELSSKSNVIVFVLDWFDQQIMDEILRQSPEFDNDLIDFTCYHNTSSRYAFTGQSIPYMLTNVEWEDGMSSDWQYVKYAFENSRLLYDISKQDYSVGVYTGTGYVASPATDLLINYSDDIRIKLGYGQTIYMMSKTSKYKMAPFAVKEKFNYVTSDINEIIANNGVWTIGNDIVFHEMINEEGLSIAQNDSYDGAFRFYHLQGAHAPFIMDENFRKWGNQISQAKGVLKIVYEYMRNMKKLGVYDDATIIITADHGQNTHVGNQTSDPHDYDLTSSPILYVKLPNEHNDKVKYSNAPVSHTELAATIINAVGVSTDSYGRTFNQISEEESRERIFTFIGKQYQKWMILGDVNDMACWELIEE